MKQHSNDAYFQDIVPRSKRFALYVVLQSFLHFLVRR